MNTYLLKLKLTKGVQDPVGMSSLTTFTVRVNTAERPPSFMTD